MNHPRYDVIVVGAGAMGSAAAWWLGRRGRRVLVVDQFEPGHSRGSSHGTARIFRLGYPLDAVRYVELASESLSLWRELERESGARILSPVGALDYGAPDEVESVRGALEHCSVHHEVLGAAAATRRWAGMRFDGDVVFHPDGALTAAHVALRALHEAFRGHGGEMVQGTGRVCVESGRDGVVVSGGGRRWTAPVGVVAAGAWAAETLDGQVPLPSLEVTREQVFYFSPVRAGIDWPCFIRHGEPAFYGLPTPCQGIKVAEHHMGPVVTPEDRDFEAEPAGRARVLGYVRDWFPGLEPAETAFETCLYTSTADENFVVDRRENLVVAAGFSGHGFKFTPLVGRLLADLADGRGEVPAMFRLPGPSGAPREVGPRRDTHL